jgi:hypothetical protein
LLDTFFLIALITILFILIGLGLVFIAVVLWKTDLDAVQLIFSLIIGLVMNSKDCAT